MTAGWPVMIALMAAVALAGASSPAFAQSETGGGLDARPVEVPGFPDGLPSWSNPDRDQYAGRNGFRPASQQTAAQRSWQQPARTACPPGSPPWAVCERTGPQR